MACLIASVVAFATIATATALVAASLWVVNANGGDFYVKAHVIGGALSGWGVFCGCTAMRLCGAARPAPTWTDRLGRIIGTAWVGLSILCVCYLALLLD